MSEQQLSAAGKAPRPGLLWHLCLLVLVGVCTNSSVGALKVVFYLNGVSLTGEILLYSPSPGAAQ